MRLVIIDSHPLFREGIAFHLAAEPGLAIVGDGACAEDAVRLVGALAPDIVLLDLSVPGGGLQLIQQIAGISSSTRVIVLAASEDEAAMLAAMKAGARGYVLKTVSPRLLVSIINDVQAGACHVSPELAMRVVLNVVNSRMEQTANQLSALTEHEHLILKMVSNGASNRQIATALNQTEAGIKNHMTTIMKKLRVNNRVQAAMVWNQAA